ncbi:MAG: bifunctional diguanylate cyclase/phosphodiesterase [Methylovirgula sp.]
MFPFITRVIFEHDWWLLALAGAICLLTCAGAIILFQRARAAEVPERLVWLSLDAIAAGFGIWATRFIAILAYNHTFGAGYNVPLTILSLLLAVLMTGAGFIIAVCNSSGLWTAALGGAVVGLGIAAVHFTGMRAVDFPGHVIWLPSLVVAAAMFGVVLGSGALFVAARRNDWGSTLLAAVLLTLAVVMTYFTAMAAMLFVPDPARVLNAVSLSTDSLSLLVASAAAAIIGLCLFVVLSDRHSKTKLLHQKILVDAALENMSQGLCMYDADGRIVLSNEHYARMVGWPQGSLEGRLLRDLLRQRKALNEFDGDPDAYVAQLIAKMAEGVPASASLEVGDGRMFRLVDHPMHGGGWVTTIEDITEWREAQTQIAHMARHDALTNLANRRMFREQLEQALRRVRRNEQVGVLCIDLDQFKDVNDSLGHPVGDELLKQVAARLNGCVRSVDTVARLGGDEFAIVQIGREPQPLDAAALAARIVEIVSAPYETLGHRITIGASIGISVAPDDGSDPDQLLKNADMALYRAKADGRGIYRFFEAGMDARAQARRQILEDLRIALVRDEFEVCYQPIYDLAADKVICFEALLRWNHPTRGNVSPTDFIPIAEETGLIVTIGDWVLRKACADAAGWPPDVDVAVNLSPAQFRNRKLVSSIISALSESGLAANRLELEITESVLLNDSAATLEALHKLREHGVRISMDDFGTGYSSLSYLRSFPFDKIKIDQSFIHELALHGGSMAIVRAVTSLAKSLGIKTTAEGVETNEQVALLRTEGCNQVQGYLFSVPQPAAEVAKMLATQRARGVA